MMRWILLFFVLVVGSVAAYACGTCGNDPNTGGLTCSDSISGGCRCRIYYLGRGVYVCNTCGFCLGCCWNPCGIGYCDPTDPTCFSCKRKSGSKVKPTVLPLKPKAAWLMAVASYGTPLGDRIGLVDDEMTGKLGILADNVQSQLVNGHCPGPGFHGKLRETGKETYEWSANDLPGGGTQILFGIHWVQTGAQGHVEIKDASKVRSLVITDKDWTYRVGGQVKAKETLKRMRWVSPEAAPIPLLSLGIKLEPIPGI
jgi:hypothetical protein